MDEAHGTAAAPGRAQGPALALTDQVLPDHLPVGAILVARVVHPFMTPVFFAAGGVIAEDGGVLQHAAIVAREFGIPAVVGVPDAVLRFGTATVLEIDGDSGLIRSLSTERQ